jgi:hypothetical protein
VSPSRFRGSRRARRVLRRLGLATGAALVVASGAASWQAWAWFGGRGEAQAAAEVGTMGAPTLAAVATLDGVTPLAPGGVGDLVVAVHNPNPFPIEVVSLTLADAAVVTSDAAGCAGAVVSLAQPVLALDPGPTAAADGDTVVRVVAAVRMADDAPSACQGASFTVPVAVAVRS